MPELPEVETIRRDLAKKILRKKITRVEVKKARLIKSGVAEFQKIITGNRFKSINRIGKLLYLELPKDRWLLVHLKMTGQLIYQTGKKIIAGGHSYSSMDFILPGKYTYVIFTFAGGGQLFFNDMRTFGYMQLVDIAQLKNILSTYGIEPLQKNFSLKNFRNALDKRKTSVKAVLLNQKIFAGIGNIYADEICFYAAVKPSRPVTSLTAIEIKKLRRGAEVIIKKSIQERGTTFNSFRDGEGKKGNFIKYLKVFQRNGQQCLRCRRGIIQKIRLAGRGTHFCPHCQA
ncbi:DNA-formamidopyrimidine glycosylase [Candidatus Falkowbacteria bacterium RIFOXYC2_FULL_47_12]|uniref:DNA-formamidopyrimidine glycosylase n=2 Tax=Candidatus Falkowiibacteriota TaxID=1752728 RepID=A0A1F5TLM6_9BACT|nr:MAG: DNA-formamidopyrimidine glycosylase [Candidatus Falkowbacteria bacterium RIFOXYA2_FULL_47_9]OGF39749.1 MAG: DNA-formamidopyrimidine glycosylase [Candidatus Falkowbacteria bacterium RIFOXYC2_FULL_47_12]